MFHRKLIKQKYIVKKIISSYSELLSTKHSNKYYLWQQLLKNIFIAYKTNSAYIKTKIILYIRENSRKLSYFPAGYESVEKIYKKIWRRWLKVNKKHNSSKLYFLFTKITHYFGSGWHTYLIAFIFLLNRLLLLDTLYQYKLLYLNLNVLKLIKVFLWKIMYKNYTISNKCHTISTKSFLVHISFSKKQPNIIISNNAHLCLWSCSSGLFLKTLNLQQTKHLKKTYSYWLTFIKTLFNKIKFIFSDTNIKLNLILISGHIKQYLNLISFICKTNFFTYFSNLILKLNISFPPIKYKKIKAIKRKFLKKFLKKDKINSNSQNLFRKNIQ